MRKRIQAWLRGPIIAIGSMALYAIALGCFLALMLLVISMEEGGENLSSSTLDMTRIVVLLSQGIGFETDSLSLSIMPLLLTVLLMAWSGRSAGRYARISAHTSAAWWSGFSSTSWARSRFRRIA